MVTLNLMHISGNGEVALARVAPMSHWFPVSKDRTRRRFEEDVRRELPVLYRVARRMTGQSEAEDLVADTLLRAFQNQDRFDGEHLRSWLITIMRNEQRNTARYQRRHPVEEMPEEFEPLGDSPWSQIAARIDGAKIIAALDTLPEEYRLVVHLFDIEEMTYDEIAQTLSIPLGTVRSRLSRGREAIRRKLAFQVEVGA